MKAAAQQVIPPDSGLEFANKIRVAARTRLTTFPEKTEMSLAAGQSSLHKNGDGIKSLELNRFAVAAIRPSRNPSVQ
jgi:hypothetical protein